jgi:toxin ParE1/3/4
MKQLVEYIGKKPPMNARRFSAKIIRATRRLEAHPEVGCVVPEFERVDLREILVRPYRIIYQVRGETCSIVTVIHAGRDLPSHLDLEDLDS